jgi:hypothetical protein
MKHSPLLALALGLAVTASWAGETTQTSTVEMQNCVTTERAKVRDPDDAVITKTCTSRLKNQQHETRSETRGMDPDVTATDKSQTTTTYSTTKDTSTSTDTTRPK